MLLPPTQPKSGRKPATSRYEPALTSNALPQSIASVGEYTDSATSLDLCFRQTAIWKPYQSPFDLFPLSRSLPSSVSEVPATTAEAEQPESSKDRLPFTDSTAFVPRSIDAILAHHLRSWLCKKRKLDLKEQKYCQYEMLGACNDDSCDRLHLSSFIPSVEDALGFIKDVYGIPAGPALSQARAEVYQQGLKLVIDRHHPTSTTTSTSTAGVKHSQDTNSIRVLLRDAKMYYDSESANLAGTSL